MKKVLIGLLIGGVVTGLFFNSFKVSVFKYQGTFKSNNKTMYIYTDNNNVKHVDTKKQAYEVVLTNLNDYIND